MLSTACLCHITTNYHLSCLPTLNNINKKMGASSRTLPFTCNLTLRPKLKTYLTLILFTCESVAVSMRTITTPLLTPLIVQV